MTDESGPVRTRPLCVAEITLAQNAPIALGQTPWRNRRISDIAGGRFRGERLAGAIRPSGADWSELGRNADGGAVTLIDVRSLWTTDDGADIYVSYAGRLVVPPEVLGDFRDPGKLAALASHRYYFRVTPTFETAAPNYAWLNEIVALGVGRRTPEGVEYTISEVL